jgi:hypothetical protein
LDSVRDLPGLGDITFGYDLPGSRSGLTAWGPDGKTLWVDGQADGDPAAAGAGQVAISAYPDPGGSTVPVRAIDAHTGAARWSVAAPASDAMNLMRMIFTGGYVVIGGATSRN